MMTVLLEYIDHSLQFPLTLDLAINIYFTLPYYAGIMLIAFNDLLYSKLCWHNRRVPAHVTGFNPSTQYTIPLGIC